MAPGFVKIQMGDNSVFEGKMTPLVECGTADWMAPMNLFNHNFYAAYIEIEIEENNHQCVSFYWAKRIPKVSETPTYVDFQPGTQGPVYALIYLPNPKPIIFYAAVNFKLYEPHKYHLRDSPSRKPINHIFVLMHAGPIYFSPLKLVDVNLDTHPRSEVSSIKRRRLNTK